MNGLNNSSDDVVECPLCMEPLEVDDLNFYPCTCGYQICRFCWHRIRTDENKLCPACRKEYPENPADFTPLTQEEMIAFKSQKRQRDQQRKQKITENRKHLANVRVVQKNLVFVVGLPPRLADADILKKHEYFGKYGKIHKVVINPSTTYAGVQGPSASAYVTYVHNSDALRAIQSVNNIMIDGRLIKTSLGTTKYCSHFMKNQQCPKSDCMYLHELGDPEASFTKEEMHQGKHQEYEKRLHDALIATAGASTTNGIGTTIAVTNGGGPTGTNGGVGGSSAMSSSSSSSTSSSSNASSTTAAIAVGVGGGAQQQQKEAWPSLSVSPVNNNKDGAIAGGGNGNGKNKKEKVRNERSKNEKSGKGKLTSKNNSNSNNNSNNSSSNKENQLIDVSRENSSSSTLNIEAATPATTIEHSNQSSNNKSRTDRNKEKHITTNRKEVTQQQQQQQQKDKTAAIVISADEEVKMFEDVETKHLNHNNVSLKTTPSKSRGQTKEAGGQRSFSSSSASSTSSNTSDDRTSAALSESSTSGKSSPGNFTESSSNDLQQHGETVLSHQTIATSEAVNLSAIALDTSGFSNNSLVSTSLTESNSFGVNGSEVSALGEHALNDSQESKTNTTTNGDDSIIAHTTSSPSTEFQQLSNSLNDNLLDTTAALSKLNLFDDSNSFFSTSAASFQQSMLLKNKLAAEMRQNQVNSAVSSHLPDLLNGIDGYQKPTNINEWEEAFKNVMMRNNKHVEEQLIHQQHLQQQQQQHHQQLLQQQEEFLRMHELQKRNNLLNNIGLSQINGPHNDFPNNFHGNNDLGRLTQANLMQQQQQQQLLQQQQQQQSDNLLSSTLFGANMSKFFDFHKNQQQQQLHQQYMLNTGSTHTSVNGTGNAAMNDPLRMASFLENNRINSQFLDNNVLTAQQQQQLQKQRLLGKFESMTQNQTQGLPPQQQSQPNRLQNQFTQNSTVDDDLGFDPFIETQKGLAELMETEVVQQQSTNGSSSSTAAKLLQQHPQHQPQHQHQQQMMDNLQRARMPPPGFNHMNAFGFGGPPRVQNTSKILPFMNNGGSNGQVVGQQPPTPQQQMQMSNNWNPHMAAFQQQQQQQHPQQHQQQLPLTESQLQHALNQSQAKGYSNNDWTTMDPAILSFRQYSSFPQQQQQMPPHPQQQQQDMFMQHLSQHQQQQQQQNGQGFGSQPPPMLPGINLPNNLLNPQQTSQTQSQINYPHTNWLSSEQSLFVNSLTNGFTNNNFDKFTIPIPPGIHPANLNKQQKTECIN